MPTSSKNAPEDRATEKLEDAGWTLPEGEGTNVSLPAVAVQEFKLDKGRGYADDLLFLDGKAVEVCEVKPAGFPVRNVDALPDTLEAAAFMPLPFAYISTGEETGYTVFIDDCRVSRSFFSHIFS